MATQTAGMQRPKAGLAPDAYDRILSAAAVFLFVMVLAALWRGRGELGEVPGIVWGHLLTIVVALALTPVMLLRRRGDRLHRRIGWVWCAAMMATAAASFGIRGINEGGLSFIHILSGFTLAMVPVMVWAARTHRVAMHRRMIRGVVTGALIVAGIFTFPVDRLLGSWLFG